MTSSLSPMRSTVRTIAAGSAVAVAAALLLAYGSSLGADLPKVALLAAAAGAVLGLVPGRPGDTAARAVSYLGGFAAVAVGLSLLRSSLPDVPTGRAISAVVVVSLVTAMAAATGDRLPLWAALLGVATLTGAFQTVLGGASTGTTTTVVTAATSALVASALAFLATTLLIGLTSPVGSSTASTADARAAVPDAGLPTPRAAGDIAAAPSHVKAL